MSGTDRVEPQRQAELPLCHAIIVVLRVGLCQAADSDTMMSDTRLYQC